MCSTHALDSPPGPQTYGVTRFLPIIPRSLTPDGDPIPPPTSRTARTSSSSTPYSTPRVLTATLPPPLPSLDPRFLPLYLRLFARRYPMAVVPGTCLSSF